MTIACDWLIAHHDPLHSATVLDCQPTGICTALIDSNQELPEVVRTVLNDAPGRWEDMVIGHSCDIFRLMLLLRYVLPLAGSWLRYSSIAQRHRCCCPCMR